MTRALVKFLNGAAERWPLPRTIARLDEVLHAHRA
jgi:hypothetical protein